MTGEVSERGGEWEGREGGESEGVSGVTGKGDERVKAGGARGRALNLPASRARGAQSSPAPRSRPWPWACSWRRVLVV